MVENEFRLVHVGDGVWKIDGDGPAGLRLPPGLVHLDRALLAVGLRLLRMTGGESRHVVTCERV